MFFKLFRRPEPAAPAKRSGAAPIRPAPVRRTRPSTLVPDPLPVGEVREDHDESAWDLWEQSQFQLDSQLGGLSARDSVRVKEDRPSQFSDLEDDPFGRIGKNHR